MNSTESEYSLLILGVAGGAGHVYHGHCSSSFMLLRKEQPVCLIDIGAGVTRAVLTQGYAIPDTLIITHNHTDHAGELPVVLRVEEAQGRHLRIVAAEPVAQRLRTHRMAEHNDLYPPDSLAEWVSVPAQQAMQITDDLNITFLETQHSEPCYGFILSRVGESSPLFGYSADSGFLPALYSCISKARVAIFDGRPTGNQWHAAIDELDEYRQPGSYIIGHGISTAEMDGSDKRLLKPGQRIPIPAESRDEIC